MEDTPMAGRYDENNSTVRWIPGFLRGFLGLNSDFEAPRYYDEPRRYPPSTPYNPDQPIRAQRPQVGIPEPVRRAEPLPAVRPLTSGPSAEGRMRFGGSEDRMRDIAGQAGYSPTSSGGNLTPGASIPEMPQTQGYTQPISFLLRGYARGALPPQGLEQFTKELRGTSQQLWEFYEYWTRFQTDELGRVFSSLWGRAPLRPTTSTTNDLDEHFQHVPVEVAPPLVVVPPSMPAADDEVKG
jgi:hypothetical protein